MPVIKIAFLGIVVVILASITKQYKPEFSLYLVLAASLFMFGLFLNNMSEVLYLYEELGKNLGEYKEYLQILIKVMGIMYICDFAAGICRDAGYQTIAGQIELCAKVSVLLSGLPILVLLLETVRGYLT